MNGFIWGVLGMLATLLLLVGGFGIGWNCNNLYRKKTAAAVKQELSETEKRRIAEEAAAFDTLMNYSADMAYGLVKNEEPVVQEE